MKMTKNNKDLLFRIGIIASLIFIVALVVATTVTQYVGEVKNESDTQGYNKGGQEAVMQTITAVKQGMCAGQIGFQCENSSKICICAEVKGNETINEV